MTRREPSRLTLALQADREGRDEVFGLIYAELRRLAEQFMRNERVEHTLQPTALVHEAYLRLSDDAGLDAEDRGRFLAIAAGAMRRALVDHARARRAEKRGGDLARVTLQDDLAQDTGGTLDILELDSALDALDRRHERMRQVVELKFFAGLTMEEIGQTLGVTARTVGEDWSVARLWLSRELGAEDAS